MKLTTGLNRRFGECEGSVALEHERCSLGSRRDCLKLTVVEGFAVVL